MRSTADRSRNLALADRLAAEAAAGGAEVIAFPENAAFLREGSGTPRGEDLDGETADRFAAMARSHRAWVLAGTIAERIPGRRKIRNTSILFDPKGRRAAVYRKMHLFDAAIPGRVSFRESAVVEAGDRPVVTRTPYGTIGLTVCFDLRFPELFRVLALSGATVVFVPSAFTAYTRSLHWEALLRARAIENQTWVVAPAQWGTHHPGRRSYGHACVVDPWGRIVAEKARGDGVVIATVDPAVAEEARRQIPVLPAVRRGPGGLLSGTRART